MRYPLGSAVTCATRHDVDPTPLYCRCGARVSAGAVETVSGERRPLLRDLPNMGGRLRRRLRVPRGTPALGWLLRTTRRHPGAGAPGV